MSLTTTRLQDDSKNLDRAKALLHPMAQNQAQRERNAIDVGVEKYKRMLENGKTDQANSLPGTQLIRRNVEKLIPAIATYQDAWSLPAAARGASLSKYLAQFEAQEVALIVLRLCVAAVTVSPEDSEMSLASLAQRIVHTLDTLNVTARFNASADQATRNRYLRMARKVSGTGKKLAFLRRNGEYVHADLRSSVFGDLDKAQKTQLGTELIRLVEETTGMGAITKIFKQGQKHPRLVFRLNDSAREWLKHAHEMAALMELNLGPMVCPPVAWSSSFGGGFLTEGRHIPNNLVRQREHKDVQDHEAHNAPRVYAAINAIQNTAWAINVPMLEIAEWAVSESIALPGLEAELKDVPEPGPRPDVPLEVLPNTPEMDQLKAWAKAKSLYFKSAIRKASRRLAVSHALREARSVADYPAIYFPHNMDWRGRAYPMSVGLSPQGNDLQKGLLTFAKAVPLGDHGDKWLRIHLSNCFGVDKVSFKDRELWVLLNERSILEDAENPKREGALWPDADSPFQFLAAAMEYRDMIAHVQDGGKTASFESSLPVGIDGSCNGLQHFSAMLRDEVGGAATNLLPAERPADIYAIVAAKVRDLLELDLMETGTESADFAAFWLGKGIDRTWTKRNTMTLAYGVSKFGMNDQLWLQIGIGESEFFGDETRRGAVVRYLAGKNWEAISQTVIAANAAMDWLHGAAKACNKAEQPITWETDDGLQIRQAYCETEAIRVFILERALRLTLRQRTDKIRKSKQISSISPNFVHSVDAAHLRAVVRRCVEIGIDSFAMIHDSFGTQAGNVEALSVVTKEEFIRIHQSNPLEQFRTRQVALLGEDKVDALPAAGSLDLDDVSRAEYFFA